MGFHIAVCAALRTQCRLAQIRWCHSPAGRGQPVPIDNTGKEPERTVELKVTIRVKPAKSGTAGEASAGATILVTLRSGSLAFVLSLPSIMAAGLIAFAPFGPDAVAIGVTTALLGTAIGLLFCAASSGTRGVVIGSTSAVALVTASVFTSMIERGELLPGDPLAGLAILVLLGLLSALFQLAMGAAQMGRLLPLLPYPVVAGLINGTAALLLVSQVPMALGLAQGAGPLAGAAVVAAVTLGLALVKWPWSFPAPVGAVVIGAALHHALAAWAPSLPLGGLVGALEPLSRHAELLAGAYARIPGVTLEAVLEVLVPAALSIALLSSFHMMASVAAIRDAGGANSASQRDMLALGSGNLAGSMAGCLTCAGILSTTLLLWRSGSRGAGATALAGLMILVILVLPLPVLGFVPVSALAGVVVATALRMIDVDVLRLLLRIPHSAPRQRAEILGSVATVLLVTLLALSFGLVIAVAAGLILALLVFASVMAHGVLRRSYASPPGRSRIRRGPHENAVLSERMGAIRVLEIEGAVFFGNTGTIDQAVSAAIADGAEHILLDMRRVDRMDLSGARRLVHLCERRWRAGASLIVTPVRPGHAVHDSLLQFGLLERLRAGAVAETLEAGLARAEAILLGGLGLPRGGGQEPDAALHALGVPPDAATSILAMSQDITVADGSALLRAGDPPDAVYLLLDGALDITMPRGRSDGAAPLYLGRLMPGALVGEMALVSGALRSADVIARGAVRCLRIGTGAIAELGAREPTAAYALLAAMARQIERNLRHANAATAALEE